MDGGVGLEKQPWEGNQEIWVLLWDLSLAHWATLGAKKRNPMYKTNSMLDAVTLYVTLYVIRFILN